ncbi:MAG: rod shape-determining protein RodA [Chthoniobacterales bacterium]|nr:rod shape-determining protein RodA [Chthoniobacterales bacterium]
MHPLLRKILGLHWPLFFLTFILAIGGVYAIYSATWFRNEPYWKNQILWIAISLPCFLIVSLMDYRWVRWGAIPIYLTSVALLVAVRFVGTERYGSERWIDLGPISIQPSQFALLAGILTVSLFLSRFRNWPPILRLLGTGILVATPCLLILLQPDLGTTIVWGPVILSIFFVAGIPKRYLLVLILLVLIAIPVMVNFGLKPYQRDRIIAFLDNQIDPLGVSWNINQSLIAIGSGGFLGKGPKATNTQNQLGFLPSTIVHNDFIFAAFAETHGFLGGVTLITLFAITILFALQIALTAEDDLGRLIATGIAAMLFTHVFMNIGMTISVTPITGLPLPLISYGGTFTLVVLICFGFLQSIWIHRHAAG